MGVQEGGHRALSCMRTLMHDVSDTVLMVNRSCSRRILERRRCGRLCTGGCLLGSATSGGGVEPLDGSEVLRKDWCVVGAILFRTHLTYQCLARSFHWPLYASVPHNKGSSEHLEQAQLPPFCLLHIAIPSLLYRLQFVRRRKFLQEEIGGRRLYALVYLVYEIY